LDIQQLTQSEKRGDCQSGALRQLNTAAEVLVEHPLGNEKLPPVSESYLHLAAAEGRARPSRRYGLAVMRMMSVMNRGAQNMRIVWTLRR
jgi:hypothetical protein